MSLKILDCEEPTIACFCNKIKKDSEGEFSSLDDIDLRRELKLKRLNVIFVGKVVKIIPDQLEAEIKHIQILVKEVLPNYEYGQKVKAVVLGDLAEELASFSPTTGDRLAFYDPKVFFNPAYQPKEIACGSKQTKYILEIAAVDEGTTVLWCAKKLAPANNTKSEKHSSGTMRNADKSPKNVLASVSSQPLEEKKVIKPHTCSGNISNGEINNVQSGDTHKSPIRKKPLIQLPQRPQIPYNTKLLKPRYTYKMIGDIVNSYGEGIDRVNFFGVVHEILKPLSTTKNNKHTLVCKLVDDSENGEIKFHFFTPDETIIKQIEIGDVVRLHRAKLEKYKDFVDGRVFQSLDITLFKSHSPNITPISMAKNIQVSEEEKKRVEALKKWYIEFDQDFTKAVLLSDISNPEKYRVLCKIVSEPKLEGEILSLKVTDGSVPKQLWPTMPLKAYKKKKDRSTEHIVTLIEISNKLDVYAKLKVGDFVFFRNVEAVPLLNSNQLQLKITNNIFPLLLSGKDPYAIDIERRIENMPNVGENIEPEKENEQLTSMNIADGGKRKQSDNDNETSIQTRLQKQKLNNSPGKGCRNPNSKLDGTQSCVQKQLIESCDVKATETDNSESSLLKSRKQLFTPNLADLSDATDETSDNLDAIIHPANKNEDVVNPANTSFNDIMEKVKTKFCSSKNKKVDSQNNHDSEDNDHQPNSKRIPILRLEKLSESDCMSYRQGRKRSKDANVSQEDLENASTIINISYQLDAQGNKRIRTSSLISEEINLDPDEDAEVDSESRGNKVSSWLFHPDNKMLSKEDGVHDEIELTTLKKILSVEDDATDLSTYIKVPFFRLQAFLLEVHPDPNSNHFDLVSGYCSSGCQQMFLFSKIFWHITDTAIPLCPDCMKTEQEKELQLMFLMELHVMDTNGQHSTIHVTREHAERFLSCTVSEFLRDAVIRKSRIQLLTDYNTNATLRCSYTPLLDMTVAFSGHLLWLVNTTLKLPNRL